MENFIVVDGGKMFLDVPNSLGLRNGGLFEPEETALVKKRILAGDVVFDVGANIGYYTLIFSRLVGPNGKVYAFEPDPVNFSILERNVSVNNYTNVELVNKAVSATTQKANLYLCKNNHGDHRLYSSNDNREKIEVDAIALDDYADVKPSFVKIDIQGSEYSAAIGMSGVLSQPSVELLAEFWPFGLQSSGFSAEKYFLLLKSHGFYVYNCRLEPIDDYNKLKHLCSSPSSFTNLFCSKVVIS